MNNRSRTRTRQILTCLSLGWALAGEVSCLNLQGNEQVLKSFGSFENSFNSAGGLVQGSDGALYGAVHAGFFFKVNVDGSGYSILRGFGTNSNDATNPIGPLVLGADKALYGISGGGVHGMGAVFKLNEDGTGYKLLHSFSNYDVVAQPPPARLLQGNDGAFYGTTYYGGISRVGKGSVFKLNADGTGYRVIYSFGSGTNYSDGSNPQAALVQGTNGVLYGTTVGGGGYPGAYSGTVFQLNPDGTSYKVLHTFGSSTDDGTFPQAGLIQGNDGTLYGTTSEGGSGKAGTVFRLNVDGSAYKVLYNFKGFGSQAAQYPKAGLTQTFDGALYGTTSGNKGAVFRINPDGTGYVLVHVFGSFSADGNNPQGSLLLGYDGALYGTTSDGGSYSGGTVFRIATAAPTQQPFALSIVSSVGGTLQLGFDGVIRATYRLDASTNFSDWVPLGTVFNESGPVQFLDSHATAAPQRFYRAVWLP